VTELVITAEQILLGPTGQRVQNGAVLVRGDKIVAVGAVDRVRDDASGAAMELEFPGATVLPGLIDGHVHLAFDAAADPAAAVQTSDDGDLLLGMASRARELIDSGVTTVRDLGDRSGLAERLRAAIEAGLLSGPAILPAGTPLTVRGGHCWFLGGEVTSDDSIRALVRRNAEAGSKVIKVMATGGGITPGGPQVWESQFTQAQLAVVVAEARAVGLPVAAHAHGTEGVAAAAAVGVDTIEHCTWLAAGGFDVRPDVVAEIVAKGIYVCPGVSPNWRAFGKRFGPERVAKVFAHVRWMDEQGVHLMAGTDAGVPFAVFGDYVGSLEFFEHLGMPRDRVIEMATVTTANAIGLGNVTGQVVAGHRADLLVVGGDPLTDLQALRRVRLVVSGGRPHVPHEAAIKELQPHPRNLG
jgi:imidazolonepropionase-like amidohydrolase